MSGLIPPGFVVIRLFACLLLSQLIILSVNAETDKVVVAADTSLPYGGPFTLTDHNHHPITDRDLHGEYLLIYFGYTFCPDICPTSLAKMSAAIKRLGVKADKVRPVLISVDPERDTPERLGAYAKAFHPRMLGLTGSREQIDQLVDSYYAIYRIHQTEEGEYLVDHTGHMYLVGPDGQFIAKFLHGITINELVTELPRFLDNK